MKARQKLEDIPGITCRRPDISGRHTTLGIGGTVAMSIRVNSREALTAVLRALRSEGRPHVILGGGSNIVFPEDAPDLVLVLNRSRGIRRIDSRRIAVMSGETNLALMAWCAGNGAAGLEFLAGIPGTVGGATAVNAGAFGRDMAASFLEAQILDPDGVEIRVGPDACGFRYRDSIFKRGDAVLLEIILSVVPDEPAEVRRRIRGHFAYRRRNHPGNNARTAGCFFKNPGRTREKTAGRLIDAAGLRGLRRQSLEVSSRHANFIVHHGGAGMTELQEFIAHIAAAVQEAGGPRLEREVLFVAPDGRRY